MVNLSINEILKIAQVQLGTSISRSSIQPFSFVSIVNEDGEFQTPRTALLGGGKGNYKTTFPINEAFFGKLTFSNLTNGTKIYISTKSAFVLSVPYIDKSAGFRELNNEMLFQFFQTTGVTEEDIFLTSDCTIHFNGYKIFLP